MNKKTKNIDSEKILLEYFYKLLENGNTNGITEVMYFQVLNEIKEKVNALSTSFAYQVEIKQDNFENIVNNANALNESKSGRLGKGIIIEKINSNRLIALPTYNLIKYNNRKPIIGHYGEDKCVDEVLSSKVKPITLSKYDITEVSEEKLDTAKRVSALFINELIQRYVKSKIKQGTWPSQCSNIDEYIFKRDIAKVIDEKGTKTNFKKAYLQAIRVVCQLLEDAKTNEIVQISNSNVEALAYANYLKMISPKSLEFLKEYSYNPFVINNSRINLRIDGKEIYYETRACTFSDPYGESSDEYRITKGILGKEPVRIMEKRIGKIN